MKTLGLIFSNIHDNYLPELTNKRTLASVPFAGRYRLIDFVLSGMVNAGISKVGIITQSNYQSLMDHVGSGKHWDLSRKNGGLIVLPPFGAGTNGMVENRLDSIKGALSFLRRSTEDFVVLSDCDNVANIDYADVIAKHIEKRADFTIVYREKQIKSEQLKNRTILRLDSDDRVQEINITTKSKGVQNVWANMIVAERKFLINTVESAIAKGSRSFRNDILRKTDVYKVYGYKFEGYFASVDSLSNYYKHSMEILDKDKRDSLFNQGMPIYTKVRDSSPCKIGEDAVIRNSMIADGCDIQGTVTNSILFRGVKVEKGAVLDGCIIMQDCMIGADVMMSGVIADKNVTVTSGKKVGGCPELPYYLPKGKKL